MSCITENTVIVEAESEQSMLNDLTAYGCGDSVYIVYRDNNLVICNFDCNGDSPWDILNSEELELAWDALIALETNYGDSDGYWTRVRSNDGYMVDIEETLADWLKENYPDIYLQVADKIKYTI